MKICVVQLAQVAAATIKASLDKLLGFPRTQIGFMTFDSTLHFYNLKVCGFYVTISVGTMYMETSGV